MRKSTYSDRFSYLYLAIAIFIMASIGYVYLNHEKKYQIDTYLQEQIAFQNIAWKSTSLMYKQGMQMSFDMFIMKNKQVLDILKKAKTATPEEKDKLRKELHKALLPLYKELKKDNLRQLHFHDAEHHSFLRFHFPEAYGDYLGDVRPSLKQAKESHTQVVGFEVGKVFSGFRNVFPIYVDGEFYGTVEFSQPYKALEEKMKNIRDHRTFMFVIKKDLVLNSVFQEQKDYYATSCFSDDWAVENSDKVICDSIHTPEGLKEDLHDILRKNQKFQQDLKKGIGTSVAFETDAGHYTITALPIYDTTHRLAAELISVAQAPLVDSIYEDYYGHIYVYCALLAIVALLLYKMIHAKNILKKEDAYKALIYNSMGEGLYVMDSEGRVKMLNSAAMHVLGYDKHEIVGKVAHSLFHVHGKNVPLQECPIYTSVMERGAYTGVQRFQKKNGEIFHTEVVSKSFIDSDGSMGSVTLFRDITEKLENEKHLKEANERLEVFNEELSARVEDEVANRLSAERSFKTVFENAPESICILDEKHVVKECNPQALKMLGCSDREEIIGHTPYEFLVQEGDGENSEQAVHERLQSVFAGKTIEMETSMRRRDGEILKVQHLVSPIKRSTNKEVISISRDITEFLRLKKDKEVHQSMLIQQSKLAELGNIMGIIAHQWKQPLNAISMLASLLIELQEDGELDEKTLKEYVDNIVSQAVFLSHTIDDFRNFYKPSTTIKKFDLSNETQKVIDLVKPKMKREGIAIEGGLQANLYVDGYIGEFKQVVLNIINNATDQLISKKVHKKVIKVSSHLDEGVAVLAIEDNAGGIPEEILENIFEPFFSTKGESGTGIGLSLAKTIIEEKMNGRIRASNSTDGALFEIVLPISRS